MKKMSNFQHHSQKVVVQTSVLPVFCYSSIQWETNCETSFLLGEHSMVCQRIIVRANDRASCYNKQNM